jgi:hypothetical protein
MNESVICVRVLVVIYLQLRQGSWGDECELQACLNKRIPLSLFFFCFFFCASLNYARVRHNNMCQESSGSETADDLKENNLSTVLQMVQSFFL